ncbi:carbohydrate ABC transporter permease [Brachybacterium sp. EF45031]|uniref:carbohydrate ABC transporter permease n=1 Tax=Brachybacterium sillae TaxID=2810536 RepID=UPI00217CE64A|nr:carbohydrate ABC transporter permease [Brachybacterium sillae]MCS6711795.1 carbohydrate ABC transporter permease [Brachybacterium sillae]
MSTPANDPEALAAAETARRGAGTADRSGDPAGRRGDPTRRGTGRSRRGARVRAQRPIWQEAPPLPERLGRGLVLLLVALAVLLPLYTVVLTSFSTEATIQRAGGMVLIPGELTLSAYRSVLGGGVVTRSVLVSLAVTAAGTVLSTAVSVLAAYGLSRTGTVLHRPLLGFFLVTLFFSAGLIPTYLVVSNLGLIDSYLALILPGAVSAFNILILRSFFQGLDQGILEAARIDGASELRILLTIVLPMSTAVIAVVALFYGVGYWNSFFNAMLYLQDSGKWPLQMVLRSYVLEGVQLPGSELMPAGVNGAQRPASLAVKMAIVVLALVPILLVYPFVQRHFTQGVLIGAVKG